MSSSKPVQSAPAAAAGSKASVMSTDEFVTLTVNQTNTVTFILDLWKHLGRTPQTHHEFVKLLQAYINQERGGSPENPLTELDFFLRAAKLIGEGRQDLIQKLKGYLNDELQEQLAKATCE